MSTINVPLSNHAARQALVEDTLAELMSVSMRDWVGALKHWQQGALSLVHLNVMMLLRSQGPLPMSRLAELLDVSDASVTGIVDRMEKRGMVERRHGESDRRIVEVYLTPAGWAMFTTMDGERRRRLTKLLDGMADDDLAALQVGLRAFRTARDRAMASASEEAAG